MNKVLSAPINVTLSLTPKCNLSCRHCFAAKKMSECVHSMDLNEWKTVIDQLADAKIFRVLFSGGEPLLFDGFVELCEYTVSKHINCSLNTNGILITPDLAAWIKRLPFRGRISVSLDGATKETHEYMRGANTFGKTLTGIKYLLNEDVFTQIFFVVTNHNWREIKDIVYMAKNMGCSTVYLNEVYPVGNGDVNSEDLVLTRENFVNAIKLCSQLIEEGYSDFISGTLLSKVKLYNEFNLRRKSGYVCTESSINGCGNGSKSIVINYDGTVSPCEMLLGVSCGNVLSDSVTNIWHNSTVLNEFREFANVKVEDLEGCKNCCIKDICDGGCRAIPYIKGNICGECGCLLCNIESGGEGH